MGTAGEGGGRGAVENKMKEHLKVFPHTALVII